MLHFPNIVFLGAFSKPLLKRPSHRKQTVAEGKSESGHKSNSGGPQVRSKIPSEEGGALQRGGGA